MLLRLVGFAPGEYLRVLDLMLAIVSHTWRCTRISKQNFAYKTWALNRKSVISINAAAAVINYVNRQHTLSYAAIYSSLRI